MTAAEVVQVSPDSGSDRGSLTHANGDGDGSTGSSLKRAHHHTNMSITSIATAKDHHESQNGRLMSVVYHAEAFRTCLLNAWSNFHSPLQVCPLIFNL